MSGPVSLIDGQAARILDILDKLLNRAKYHVVNGGIVTDGGTTQASGASAALNYDIDTTAIEGATVDGVFHGVLAAQVDADATAGSGLDWGATSGKSVIFGVVYSTGAANDTPAIEAVYGTVADTGQQIPPTDAEITASLGHSNWVRVCNHTINRTADTTVTHAFDHDVRNPLRDYSALATTEAAFRS